jgi:hypothetical protein
MTARRRTLDNDDGQESLFSDEALEPAPTPVPWEHPAPARGHIQAADAERAAAFEARAPAPQDEPRTGFVERTPLDEPQAGFDAGVRAPLDEPQAALDAGVRAPLDEAQEGAIEYAEEPSADDFAAHAYEADMDAAPANVSPEMRASPAPTEVPVHNAGDELDALERATVPDDVGRPRAALAGPTLDDVMSRGWESLVTRLPAACPVCHGEVVPAADGAVRGRCSSCGTTID